MKIIQHLIGYEIRTAKVCPYRFLFDNEFISRLQDTVEFKFSNIYFFCRVKKIRFDIDDTELINKRTLKTTLLIGDSERKTLTASFYDLTGVFRNVHSTKEDYKDLVSDEDPFWDCKFIKEESNTNTLVFKQIATPTNQAFDFIITPENFQFDLDLDLNNPPEVIYVGQSFRMLDRIQSHKTLNKAVSKLKDSEDLRLYFLTFKFGYGGHRDHTDFEGDVSKVWLSEYGKTKEFKSKIDLVERFLIHFLKPELNEQHVLSKINEDSIVKHLLLENDVTAVTVSYGMHGHGFQFWSQGRALAVDNFTFDFNDVDRGYFKGLE
jgi:hypothetical protein